METTKDSLPSTSAEASPASSVNKALLSHQTSYDSGYNTHSSTFSQESITERLSESFISNESKRKYELIHKTPSKYEDQDFSSQGKSPFKSGGKNPLQHLWASVSRLSPKMSPVDKKPNLGSRFSLISANEPNTDDDSATRSVTYQSTPFEGQKQIKRVLFGFPKKGEGETAEAETTTSNSSCLPSRETTELSVFPRQSSFNKFCEKTNALFRLPLANSPQKKGQQLLVNNIISENINSVDGRLYGLSKSKAGDRFIDFMTEFSNRNMDLFLLKFLTNQDLFGCALVNNNWNEAVDFELGLRKKKFEERRKEQLEDLRKAFCGDDYENDSPCTLNRKYFECISKNERRQRSTSSLVSSRDLNQPMNYSMDSSPCSSVILRPGSVTSLTVNRQSSYEESMDTSGWSIGSGGTRVEATSSSLSTSVFSYERYHFCNLCDSPYHGATPCREVNLLDNFISPYKLRASLTSLNTSCNNNNSSPFESSSTSDVLQNNTPANEVVNIDLCKRQNAGSKSSLCSKKARSSLRRL